MENPVPEGASSKGEWEVSKVPPGSTLDRGMCEEKRKKMDRFYKVGTLNSGGPESVPEGAERHRMADCDQPQEDAVWTLRESDPLIVVRDGNTGHKAKGRAGSNASKALTSGHVDLGKRCQAPCLHWKLFLALCVGSGFICALPEEPGAVIPHAGICEGGVGQPTSLP